MYRLLLHRDVARQLEQLPRPTAHRLAEAMRVLPEVLRPVGAVHLEAELYRVRVGLYHIIYAVIDTEQVVFVGKVVRHGEETTTVAM